MTAPGAPRVLLVARATEKSARVGRARSADDEWQHEDAVGGRSRDLEYREAVVSLGAAVFARGGTVIVPADPDLATLLGTVAARYGGAPTIERFEDPQPFLVVHETTLPDPALRALMADFLVSGLVSYVDRDGVRISGRDLDAQSAEWAGDQIEDLRLLESRRQPVTSTMLETLGPFDLACITPDTVDDDERALLESSERVVVFPVADAGADEAPPPYGFWIQSRLDDGVDG